MFTTFACAPLGVRTSRARLARRSLSRSPALCSGVFREDAHSRVTCRAARSQPSSKPICGAPRRIKLVQTAQSRSLSCRYLRGGRRTSEADWQENIGGHAKPHPFKRRRRVAPCFRFSPLSSHKRTATALSTPPGLNIRRTSGPRVRSAGCWAIAGARARRLQPQRFRATGWRVIGSVRSGRLLHGY